MEAIIIIVLLVWIISSLPAAIREGNARIEQEEREREANAREDVYFTELKAKADSGDQQAINSLIWFGYDAVAHGWRSRK